MIKKLWGIIFGKCNIRCDKTYAKDVLGIIKDHGIIIDRVSYDGDLYVLTVPEKMLKPFKEIADNRGIEYTVERKFGIPKLYVRYKHRPGILIGMVLFLMIVYFSGMIVWDFEITGNEMTADTEIISALEAVGCSSGKLISQLDIQEIQNNCLVNSDSFAWISVNMDGNLARVEVREKRRIPPETDTENDFVNIVAAEDGVIELCRVKNGKATVYSGTVVRKGDLLISGVINLGESGVRYEHADGEVFATVYREIESYIPYERQIQVPTGEEKTDYSIKIFGKSTNISLKGSIDYKLYGKIIENVKLTLPFGITLPVWVNKTVYSELEEQNAILDKAEATKIAKTEAYAKLKEMSDSLQVLSVEEKTVADDTGVGVKLCVYGVTDISANRGFTVSGAETP